METTKKDDNQTSLSQFNRLPNDITANILSRLPIKYVFRSRAVSKPWRTVIDAPKFALLQYESGKSPSFSFVSVSKRNLYIVEDEEEEEEEGHTLKSSTISLDFHQTHDVSRGSQSQSQSQSHLFLVGSCNGLVCLCSWSQAAKPYPCLVYIFNPTTGEVVSLPDITPSNYQDGYISSGFGFDPCKKEFKVVLVFQMSRTKEGNIETDVQMARTKKGRLQTEVQVFTLGSNSWKKITYPEDVDMPIGVGFGVFVNGSVNWIVFDGMGMFSIVSFHIGHEKFSVIPMPIEVWRDGFQVVTVQSTESNLVSSSQLSRLGVLGGCLCLTYAPEFDEKLEIWVMKEYNVRASWTKKFYIDTQSIRRIHEGRLFSINDHLVLHFNIIYPVCLLENGEIVLLYNCEFVVSYNHKSGKFSSMLERDGPGTSLLSLSYVRSLISPNQPA